MKESKYSIHDLSRIEADLPRFIKPYEFGIDYGIKHTLDNTKKIISIGKKNMIYESYF